MPEFPRSRPSGLLPGYRIIGHDAKTAIDLDEEELRCWLIAGEEIPDWFSSRR